jgi:hypothetical protein
MDQAAMRLGEIMRQLGSGQSPNQPAMSPMPGQPGFAAAPIEGETFPGGAVGVGRAQMGLPVGDNLLSIGVTPMGIVGQGMKPQGQLMGADVQLSGPMTDIGAQYRRQSNDIGNKPNQSFMFGLNKRF